MKTYKELQEDFNRKVKELQEKCEHTKTYWAEQWWAIAHSTGNAVRICEICNKQLETISLSEAYKKGYLEDYAKPIKKR